MLTELTIENVAIIEKADVLFSDGLNVLTGETGAGKSILIDSINSILGNRTTKEIVRTGAEKAEIIAVFDRISTETKHLLSELGFSDADDLVIQREVYADGGSKCRINHRPAALSAVREVCRGLINIHGQHDNQELLNPERHLFVIDRFAGLVEEREAYAVTYQRLQAVTREMESISTDEEKKAKQIELLEYQINEIEQAELVAGEDTDLQAEKHVIRNAETILQTLNASAELFTGSDDQIGAVSALYEASESLAGIAHFSEDYRALSEAVSEQYFLLSDTAGKLQSLLLEQSFDAHSLAEIEERLDFLFRLKRKYGSTIEEIFSFLEQAKNDRASILQSEEALDNLEKERKNLLARLNMLAKALSEKRMESFQTYSSLVMEEMSYLNLKGAKFVVQRQETPPTSTGIDDVSFLLSANIGEEEKPLARIASGGELSRIMLAIKNVLADKDTTQTLIFDEIDSGVGGSSAHKIGKKLKQSAHSRQTICVTHAPQIAAFADRHLQIQKKVERKRTITEIHVLSEEDRTYELARMLSGDVVTDLALKTAAEMRAIAKEGRE